MGHGEWKDMFKAVQNNDIELVSFYIRMGIDINYQHPEYMTSPLIESIRLNNTEMMVFLLKNGALPGIKEFYSNKDAVSIAKEVSNEDAIQILSEYSKK